MTEILLKSLLLHHLIELAEAYGMSYPTFLKASKQLGQMITGTMIAEMSNSDLSWNLFVQGIIDTRSLHFWVLSCTSPQDFIIRLCQYAALETVGISFGHLKNGVGAIALGGFRNSIGQELAPTILYNSTQIKAVMAIEKNTIAIAALVGKKGRSILPVILKLIGGHQDECVKSTVLTPLDAQTVAFQKDCKIIIENIFQEHTIRRCLQGSIREIKTVAPISLVPIASTPINATALICWTSFGVGLIGFTTLGALYLFQRAEHKRSQNKNDGITIDVTSSLSE